MIAVKIMNNDECTGDMDGALSQYFFWIDSVLCCGFMTVLFLVLVEFNVEIFFFFLHLH